MRMPLAALAFFLCTACLCGVASAQDKSLTLYTSLAPTESRPLAQAFEKKTGIKVELWRAISEKVVQRAITEARARRFTVDVVETNAPEMEMMAREKLFAELDSPHLADLPAAAPTAVAAATTAVAAASSAAAAAEEAAATAVV